MKSIRTFLLALSVASIALLAGAAPAANGLASGLSLVPPDSLAVAVVHIDQLRSSDLAAPLFHEADDITVGGEAATFLKDAGLDPKRDIDGAVLSLSSSGSEEPRPLVAFEGRFDPAALSAATLSRGAAPMEAAGVAYFRLPEKSKNGAHGGEKGAVAFLSPRLILAGSEPALLRALDLSASGHSGLSPKSALAGMVAKIDPKSSAWVVVDASRARELKGVPHAPEHAEGPASAVYSALRSVSGVLFQASLSSKGVEVKAMGLSSDEESRQNIEDVLRGMIAAWRMAVQDKRPELVSALRKFSVSRDSEGVTISGKLPAELFKAAHK